MFPLRKIYTKGEPCSPFEFPRSRPVARAVVSCRESEFPDRTYFYLFFRRSHWRATRRKKSFALARKPGGTAVPPLEPPWVNGAGSGVLSGK